MAPNLTPIQTVSETPILSGGCKRLRLRSSTHLKGANHPNVILRHANLKSADAAARQLQANKLGIAHNQVSKKMICAVHLRLR